MSTVDRCTCYQELLKHVGDGFSKFQITEKDESCPEHGELEHILATGRYTDRRGRVWEYSDNPSLNEWFADIPGDPLERGWWCRPKEMRLLIERDQHRDECVGLNACWDHPVPSVITSCESGGEKLEVYAAHASVPTKFRDTLPEAMDAARSLAVNP